MNNGKIKLTNNTISNNDLKRDCERIINNSEDIKGVATESRSIY